MIARQTLYVTYRAANCTVVQLHFFKTTIKIILYVFKDTIMPRIKLFLNVYTKKSTATAGAPNTNSQNGMKVTAYTDLLKTQGLLNFMTLVTYGLSTPCSSESF